MSLPFYSGAVQLVSKAPPSLVLIGCCDSGTVDSNPPLEQMALGTAGRARGA